MTFLRYWIDKNQLPRTLNKIIIVDPAKTKDYKSDFTVIQVWGLSARREFWLIDMVRDKLALGERWEKVRDFGIEYGVIDLAYETINNTDIEYIRERMEAEAVYFNITEIGGNIPKVVRISALHPLFKNGRIILPKVLSYRDSEKQHHNLVSEFLYDEYTLFPYCTHDDMLDCMARLLDKKLSLIFPTMNQEEQNEKKKGNMAFDEGEPDISWMSQ